MYFCSIVQHNLEKIQFILANMHGGCISIYKLVKGPQNEYIRHRIKKSNADHFFKQSCLDGSSDPIGAYKSHKMTEKVDWQI